MYDSYDVTTSRYNNFLTISEKGCITKLLNETFEKYNDYDFYMIANDDIIFETPLWDLQLAKKGYISHGKDAIPEGADGNFLMIDGDFCRAVGWLQMPTLNRYCGDTVWKFIAEQLGILNYRSDIIIRHNWEGCAEPTINIIDMQAFANWLPVAYKDINKIKEVLCK